MHKTDMRRNFTKQRENEMKLFFLESSVTGDLIFAWKTLTLGHYFSKAVTPARADDWLRVL